MGVVWPSIFGPCVCGAGLWVPVCMIWSLVRVDWEPLRGRAPDKGHQIHIECVCVCLYMHLRLCVSVPLSVRLRVFLCLALLCVCESHPLTAAELSLIQLCLLSCLPAASAPPAQPWLCLGLPLPASLQPPIFASGPGSGSESPLRVTLSLFVMVTTSACMSLLVPFLPRPLFFPSQSFIRSANLFSCLPPTLPASVLVLGAWGWITPEFCSEVLVGRLMEMVTAFRDSSGQGRCG